jgi:hypothetical protein
MTCGELLLQSSDSSADIHVAMPYAYLLHGIAPVLNNTTAEVNSDWSDFAASVSAAWHHWRQHCPNHYKADALAAACILPLKGGDISIYNIINTTTAAATVDNGSKHVTVKHEAVAPSSNGDEDMSDATPIAQKTAVTAATAVKTEATPAASKAAAMFMCDGRIVGNILGYIRPKEYTKTETTTDVNTSDSGKGVGSSGNSAVAAVLRSKVLLRAVPYDTLVHEPLALLRCRQGVLASPDVFTAMINVLQSALTASATVARAAAHRRR